MDKRQIFSPIWKQSRKVNDDPVAQSAVAARRSVLWPLSKELGTTHAQTALSATLLLTAWRGRVLDLAVTGYSPPQGDARRTACFNCRPSMVRSEGPKTIPCCEPTAHRFFPSDSASFRFRRFSPTAHRRVLCRPILLLTILP